MDYLSLMDTLRRGLSRADRDRIQAEGLAAIRILCPNCGHLTMPVLRGYHFDELTAVVECSLCGRVNRLPIGDWAGGLPGRA